MNIRKRLIVILIAAAIPGMLVAFFLASSALRDEQRRTAQTAEWLARLQASSHSNVIGNAKTILDMVRQAAVAADDGGQSPGVAACNAFGDNWPTLYGSFTSLTYFSPEGDALCTSVNSELETNVAGTEWFNQAVDSRDLTYSDYTLGEDGTPLIIAAQPIQRLGGAVQGVIALGIDLNWLSVISGNIDLPEGANVTAIDRNGTALTRRKGAPPDKPDDLFEKVAALLVDELSGALFDTNVSGQDRVYGFATTEIGNLTIIVELPPFVPFQRSVEALFNTLAAPLAILFLALLATAWASETFVVRWVRALTATADRLTEGDLQARTDVPYSQGEIGQLAATFDDMAEAIEQKQLHTESLVTQREGLLQELNHRTANNMAMLSSLVDSERRRQSATDGSADDVLADLGGRIRTLATVHRLLYDRVDTATALERREALGQIVDMLAEFYTPPKAEVHLRREIAPIDLDTDRSVTFALILNELVCNAYKHAFGPGDRGTLSVECRTSTRDGVDRIELTVEDDGRGLPEDFDENDSLVVATALARQLGGAITISDAQPGTRVEVSFPVRPEIEPIAEATHAAL